MFVEAYLIGITNMVKAKSDLDRLKFAPQQVKGGNLINFEGAVLVSGLTNIKDVEIFDADRVNNTKRCTSALLRDYFEALDKVMPLFSNIGGTTIEGVVEEREVYGADIVDLVASGDKKSLRTLLREYKKDKWATLHEDDVEDAIDDIKDCVDDKDIDGVKEIIGDLIGEDICEVCNETTNVVAGVNGDNTVEPAQNTTLSEDEKELILDIEDAIKDEDVEDLELLLKELGSGHPRYGEFSDALKGTTETTTDSKDETIVKEICEDIDYAIEDKLPQTEIQDILVELLREVGEDSEVYKVYADKVNPPKTERKRRPRGGK